MWPRSGSLEFDSSGTASAGALAYFYSAGTTSPLTVYQDGAESTPHEQPVEADGNGRWPLVFVPFGTYKFILKTAAATVLFTADEVPNPEPFDESFTLDTTTILNTGDVFFSIKNGTRSGAVRLNGRTIGDASSSATERANADCADLFAFLWNNVANGQAAVSTGRGATAVADFAAHKTITLPSARSAHPLGFDDMGNSAASLLGSAPVVSGSTILAGSILGENTHVLTSSELAGHTHSFSATTDAGSAHSHAVTGNTAAEASHTHTGTTGTESADHTHTYNTPTNKATTATGVATIGGNIWNGLDSSATSSGKSATHTHTFTSNAGSSHLHAISLTSATESAHTHAVSGTSGSTGSDGAHNNVARSLLVTWYIKL